MKKILAFMSAVLMLTACGSDEPNLQCDNLSDRSSNVKTDNIVSLAQNAYETFYQNPSRSSKVGVSSVVPMLQTNSRSGESDTLLYIVNMDNNAGFVIVSDILRNTPILAVSDKGNIIDPDNVDNHGMEFYLNAARDYISTYSDTDSVKLFRKHVIEYPYAPEKVSPRCKVEWGQQYPEGYFCPNKIAGCVITATVQALSYFEAPDTIYLTYPERDKDFIVIDWQKLKNLVRSTTWSYYNENRDEFATYNDNFLFTLDTTFKANIDQEKNLGRICRELGHRYHASYGEVSTGAFGESLPSILNSLNISSLNMTYAIGHPVAKEHIRQDGIIFVIGFTNKSEGHDFLIDGYEFQQANHYIFEYNSSNGNYDILVEQYIEKTDYQHINWGANGKYNGYFNMDIFNPILGTKYDSIYDETKDYDFGYSMTYFVLKNQRTLIL